MARVFKVGTDFNCVMRRDDEHQLAYAWPEELPYFEPGSVDRVRRDQGVELLTGILSVDGPGSHSS